MKLKDLTGNKYGFLTVIKREGTYISPKGSKMVSWLCKCDCGRDAIFLGNSLKSGKVKSCGCRHFIHKFNETKTIGNETYIFVKDKKVIIDTEDLKLFYPYRVTIGKKGYAYANKKLLHKIIKPVKKGFCVDHINRNRLDNRKCNLREVTVAENGVNRKTTSNTGEPYIHKTQKGYFIVEVDNIYRGVRKTLDEAVILRNEAIKGTRQETLNYTFSNPGVSP